MFFNDVSIDKLSTGIVLFSVIQFLIGRSHHILVLFQDSSLAESGVTQSQMVDNSRLFCW